MISGEMARPAFGEKVHKKNVKGWDDLQHSVCHLPLGVVLAGWSLRLEEHVLDLSVYRNCGCGPSEAPITSISIIPRTVVRRCAATCAGRACSTGELRR